ncbi:hypothetical protein V3C99_001438 [Haemonchus contortus]
MKLILIFLLYRLSGTQAHQCSVDEFSCATGGQCIPRIKWQDDVEDCWDGSDEFCLPWQLDCGFGSPRCISKKKVNDGRIDCYSGLDEACPSHYFVCKDKSACIDPALFQDGVRQCKDGSDEPCAPGLFPCTNSSKCISMKKFQNGINDCADGSDEECTTSQVECGCGKVRCVNRERVGDGFWDCEDGTDELFNVTRGKYCEDGSLRRNGANSLLVGELQLCTDSSLCHRKFGEICVVVGGSWRCVCQRGSVRLPGSTRCIPITEVDSYLREPIPNCTRARQELRTRFDTSSGLLGKLVRAVPYQKGVRRAPSSPKPQAILVPQAVAAMNDGEVNHHRSGRHETDVTCSGNSSCACSPSSTWFNGTCIPLLNECGDKALNDCDPNATCMDNPLSYECLCRENFLDVSPDPVKKPGRKCIELVNECSDARLNDCSPNAKCIDKAVGYACRCVPGFADTSPPGRPGRNCTQQVNECAEKLHDCDPNAICRDEPIGYRCHCPFGFADASKDPSKPGRLCVQLSIECEGCNSSTSHCVPTAGGSVVCTCLPGFQDLNPINPGQNCSKLTRTS